MLTYKVILWTIIIIITLGVTDGTGASIRIYNSTAEVSNRDVVPQGSTVVLVCPGTPTTQQVDYQWECPNPPCDGHYKKVYGNVLVVVATPDISGTYRCRPGSSIATGTLLVQRLQFEDQLVIYNNGRRLLPNTLFTSIDQIKAGLTCTRRSGGVVPNFRRQSDSTTLGTRSTQSTTVQAVSLQPNGGYQCYDGTPTREFFVYYGNAILPAPQVTNASTTTDQQLHLLLTIPPLYNSGRFILRYNCTIGEANIEVEYRSADPVANSNALVTRSRSCFVVGEISTVTVWFVNEGNISTTPAVFDVDSDNKAATTISGTTSNMPSPVTTQIPTTIAGSTTTTSPDSTQNSSTPNTIHSAGTTSSLGIGHSPIVIYIGAGAAGGSLVLVLVVVLAVIICCVVAVHRRGKRSRSTEHTHTLHYHSTPAHEQQEEPQVQMTPGNYDTVGETSTSSFFPGTLYDEVDTKLINPKPVAVPSDYELVDEVNGDNREAPDTATNPESFYAQPDMTAKSNKEKKETIGAGEDSNVLYAEVDKSKKKKKGKEKKEEQPQGDLYAVVDKTSKKKGKEKKAKEKEHQADGDLYAEVDKAKKKNKDSKKDEEESQSFTEEVDIDSPPPVPDRGLIYEPSADRDDSDEEEQQQQEQPEDEQQQ